jgi:hypothetical protein
MEGIEKSLKIRCNMKKSLSGNELSEWVVSKSGHHRMGIVVGFMHAYRY